MGFWLVAGLISASVALVIAMAVLRPRGIAGPSAAYDLQVYRDQLAEVDRDAARGILSPEDAARTRTEVSRRILEADREMKSAAPPRARGADAWLVGLALIAAFAGAFAIYGQIGAPGYPDLPLATRIDLVETARATRPGQDAAEAQVPFRERPGPDAEREEMVAQLRSVMERRPDDIEGLSLLALNEARLGNFRAARLAQSRLIELLEDDVTARHHIDLAEMMVLAAGGYVSPEAEAALRTGLEMDPRDGTGRYYLGLMYAQQGRADLAFPIWRNLAAESAPDAPWLEPILLQIEEVAARAGTQLDAADLPRAQGTAPGPDAAQIDAAGEMSNADRMAMIEGMVQGLSERLATEGGPAEDWARLITSQIVLGRIDDARLIYAEALEVFAEDSRSLVLIQQAGSDLDNPQ